MLLQDHLYKIIALPSQIFVACFVCNKDCYKLKSNKCFNACYSNNTMRLVLLLFHFTHGHMRQREATWLAQGHRTGKWQTWILKPCRLALEFIPSDTLLYCLTALKTLPQPTKSCQCYLLEHIWIPLGFPHLHCYYLDISNIISDLGYCKNLLWVSVHQVLSVSDLAYTADLKKIRCV